MPTTQQIRSALQATIQASMAGTYWQVSGYTLINPTPPCVDLIPAGVLYDVAMARGADAIRWTVRVVVPANLDPGWQSVLDNLIDSTSTSGMKSILETRDSGQARSLGGVVSDCRVVQASEYKIYPVVGSDSAVGVEFTVEILP